MNKSKKWLILFTIIMIISFFISGFFFLKSGLINLGTGEVNSEVVIQLEKFSFEFNNFFGIPNTYDSCYNDWCINGAGNF